MTKTVQWEYVISAMSHVQLDHGSIFQDREVFDKINDMLGKTQDMYNHKVSLLFNAFTEKANGPKLSQYTNAYNIHSDSGGLQVVTLGKKVDEEIRKKIYKVQADYSDVAMSFDEMPVDVGDSRSGKLDIATRRFDSKKFDEMSRQSGKNLLEQINFFLDEGTTTRPLVILHGNDITWYQRNLDLILSEIPQDKWQYIDGISCGSGAMGFGDLENIERAAVMAFIEAPEHMKKKYHVLGVGSLGRMMPLVSLVRNGVFDKDVHISYDSSSLTVSFTMGFYHFDSYWCKEKLSKVYDETFMRMYDDVSVKSKRLFGLDIDREDLFRMMCVSKKESNRGDHPQKFIANAAVLFNSVLNFNHLLDRITNDDSFFEQYVNERDHNLQSLKIIKSLDDFKRWKAEYGRHFKSLRVEDSKTSASIDNFFG